MRSPAAGSLWIMGILLAASGCDDPAASTGVDPTRASVLQARNVSGGVADGEIHLLGDFALYVPAAAEGPRAVLVALGGPNTKAIVTGEPFGAPLPPVEAALQAMGQSLRALADEHRIAILGTSLAALPQGAASDQRILEAIEAGAEASGQPGLSTVPLLLFGFSGGGPEASGFTARHPERVAGLLLKVPAGVASLTTEAQRRVPTFMVLAQFEAFVDNAALGQAFAANRGGGALWAMAMEPGVPHHAFSPNLRAATLEWIGSVVGLRLAGSSGRLRAIVEQSGWLGDPSTGEVSPWGGYRGDRSEASWFPTRSTAEQWRRLIGVAPVSGAGG